ncbi:MAG TPA: DUF6496 domain-containing protein [Acidobacteriaceae bacterium]|jgi:hypothetical protein|nr:DUF6496 domain-containing protein [Acidobacteriaceae bacterium]
MATKKATRKSAAKKAAAKKSPAKKSASKKTAAKKSSAKKSSAKKPARKYSPGVGKQVKTELHEMHQGKLKSGRSGKKVTNPKQAIAIGLSEARKKGEKVPPNPNE